MNEEFEEALFEAQQVQYQMDLMVKARAFPGLIVDLVINSPDPVIFFEIVDGVLDMASPGFAQMLGYSSEELTGVSFLDLLHPADISITSENIDYPAQGIPPQYFCNRYKHKEGHYVWLLWYPAKPPSDRKHGVAFVTKLETPPDNIRAGFCNVLITRKIEFV